MNRHWPAVVTITLATGFACAIVSLMDTFMRTESFIHVFNALANRQGFCLSGLLLRLLP